MLSYWGKDKMPAILQTIYSNAFHWMLIALFWLEFHWSLFLRFQITTNHYLKQWWYSLLTHMCATRNRGVVGDKCNRNVLTHNSSHCDVIFFVKSCPYLDSIHPIFVFQWILQGTFVTGWWVMMWMLSQTARNMWLNSSFPGQNARWIPRTNDQ